VRIINENLLEQFRRKRRCEWCGHSVTGCDPHHVFTRGAGRLDLRINLIGLCRECHNDVHLGHIARFDLLAVVAAREGMSQDVIEAEIYRLRRLPKEAVYEVTRPAAPVGDGTTPVVEF
jgi:hypothetical protein